MTDKRNEMTLYDLLCCYIGKPLSLSLSLCVCVCVCVYACVRVCAHLMTCILDINVLLCLKY